MKLSELLRGVDVVSSTADMLAEVSSISADSRLVKKGSLFVAIRGFQQDGSKFIGQAVNKGAAAVVAERRADSPVGPGPLESGPYVQVRDARSALAVMAAIAFGRFSYTLLLPPMREGLRLSSRREKGWRRKYR